MEPKIEASPFINTKCSIKAKNKLYNLPFEFDRIANKSGEEPVKMGGFWESDEGFKERVNFWTENEKRVLFNGWVCKDMQFYQEIYDKDRNIFIIFEANEYVVNYSDRKFHFPLLPETIDDFITDLRRIGIKLFWKPEIVDSFGIENISSNKKIIDYYRIIKDLNGTST